MRYDTVPCQIIHMIIGRIDETIAVIGIFTPTKPKNIPGVE